MDTVFPCNQSSLTKRCMARKDHPSQKIHGKKCDGCDPGQGKGRTDKEAEEKEEQNGGQAVSVLSIVDKSKSREQRRKNRSQAGEQKSEREWRRGI